ncbi:MAG: hypothetical protein ACOVQ2_00480 [Flavobacterium sp.]
MELIKNLHSWWAYLTFAILVTAIINAFLGYRSKKIFEDKDYRISLFALIFSHIQLVIGFILYLVEGRYETLSEMKVPEIRLLALEHPLINIIGIALITIGWSKSKKVEGTLKFRKILFFYTLGLLLILSRIPWENWL